MRMYIRLLIYTSDFLMYTCVCVYALLVCMNMMTVRLNLHVPKGLKGHFSMNSGHFGRRFAKAPRLKKARVTLLDP